jgi:glycosyltransferase involved in cell wall biosynthesis
MPFAVDDMAKNAMGGTEIMKYKLMNSVDKDLLENFQIFVSRVTEELSDKHVRLLWLQDLAGDPASEHLANGGWEKFNKLIFSSHWQMRGYIERYNIPWSKCVVIHNGVEPIELIDKPRDKIKMIYTSTPHRGLNILYAVFDRLSKERDDIELDVYSSFKLYGWGERDTPYQELFKLLEDHPKINYYGSVSNEEVRKAYQNSHIFAYPSIWQETSCLCLMEAMSAGNICVHPNYGALYETASNWTYMYQWNEDVQTHASLFYSILKDVIDNIKSLPEEEYKNKLLTQKSYMDVFYNWNMLKNQWESLLKSLVNEPRELPTPSFVYRTP